MYSWCTLKIFFFTLALSFYLTSLMKSFTIYGGPPPKLIDINNEGCPWLQLRDNIL